MPGSKTFDFLRQSISPFMLSCVPDCLLNGGRYHASKRDVLARFVLSHRPPTMFHEEPRERIARWNGFCPLLTGPMTTKLTPRIRSIESRVIAKIASIRCQTPSSNPSAGEVFSNNPAEKRKSYQLTERIILEYFQFVKVMLSYASYV